MGLGLVGVGLAWAGWQMQNVYCARIVLIVFEYRDWRESDIPLSSDTVIGQRRFEKAQ